MKKFFVILMILVFSPSMAVASYIDRQLKEVVKNTRYNSVQKYNRSYHPYKEPEYKVVENLKDPKLISLSSFKPVDEQLYKSKLAKDEQVYKNKIQPILAKNMNSINVEPAAVDFYKVYRISERIIRANNLDYVNWRVAIRKSEDVNASSFDGNYIRINTALYDSLCNSDDALAFVIAHEMAHQIMGHNQRFAELDRRIEKFERYINKRTNIINRKLAYEEIKRMEFSSDTEALILLTKAGFSPERAMEALYALDTLPNVRQFYMTHPLAKERIKNAQENIAIADPNWENIGRANIYNSEVIPCKKSSDRVSIILSKTSQTNKKFYEPENIEQRLTRIAYVNYIHGNMKDAAKYFEKLADIKNDYVSYLYLSYANEYLFFEMQAERYLKDAKNAILKASELNPNDNDVKAQLMNLQNL